MSLTAGREIPAELPVAGARDFWLLLKPRVMSLVVFTGLVGLLLAPGTMHPVLALTALLCIALGAGAAGAINMWYDADIDARMRRTRARPIPAGRMTRGDALAFGSVLAVAAVLMMGLFVNLLAAGLLAATIGFYVFIYTMWLKRRTPQNIVIGGAAGALPPLIGWAAASGEIGVLPVILFAIIFFWTPPHFWALALDRAKEYAAAGVPMLPVVAGLAATRRQIALYSLIYVPLTLAPWAGGYSGPLYGGLVALLGLGFLLLAGMVWRGTSAVAPRRLFGYSILHLFLVFAALLADRAATAGAAWPAGVG
ncbi:MAG: protoheme IX farnesyltransferase [Alphaproteobacteria bacterium]|nr:protoheme IX farnesyltransferase [Alphaproteobacteria bacterium]